MFYLNNGNIEYHYYFFFFLFFFYYFYFFFIIFFFFFFFFFFFVRVRTVVNFLACLLFIYILCVYGPRVFEIHLSIYLSIYRDSLSQGKVF